MPCKACRVFSSSASSALVLLCTRSSTSRRLSATVDEERLTKCSSKWPESKLLLVKRSQLTSGSLWLKALWLTLVGLSSSSSAAHSRDAFAADSCDAASKPQQLHHMAPQQLQTCRRAAIAATQQSAHLGGYPLGILAALLPLRLMFLLVEP